MLKLDREDTKHAKPCCGITAIAIFTGAPFADVWEHVKREGRKGGRWKGTTYHHDQKSALKAFNKGRTVTKRVKKHMTLKTFTREYARPGVMYMIRTTGHQQVLLDGYVVDQNGVSNIEEYHGRAKIVRHFWAKQA